MSTTDTPNQSTSVGPLVPEIVAQLVRRDGDPKPWTVERPTPDTERDERLRESLAHGIRAGKIQRPVEIETTAAILAAEVARLDAVVTAVREEHELVWVPNGISGDSDLVCGCGWIAEDEDDHCPTVRALDGVDKQS